MEITNTGNLPRYCGEIQSQPPPLTILVTFGPVKGGISPLTEETNGHFDFLLYL